MPTKRLYIVLVCLLFASAAAAQNTNDLATTDRDLLLAANDTLSSSSYTMTIDAEIAMPNATLQTNGSGAVQAPRNGLFSRRTSAPNFEINLNGTMDAFGANTPFDYGAVGLGSELYVNGLLDEGWALLPPTSNLIRPLLPRNGDFVTVTRAADATINNRTTAVFTFDYDLADEAVQGAVAAATRDLPSLGGAIATGESAATLLRDADLTLTQYVDAQQKRIVRMEIDLQWGETTLNAQIDIEDYGRRVNIQRPAQVVELAPDLVTP